MHRVYKHLFLKEEKTKKPMNASTVQQINLYQDDFRPRREWLSAANLARGGIALGVLLVLYSLLISWNFYRAASLEQSQQARLDALTSQLAEARRAFPPAARDLQLAEAVNKKQQDVARKRRVLDTLSGQSFGNTHGFADHFAALARQRTEGVWLTGVRIAQGGTRFDVRGGTLEPDLVPRFLKNLSAEQAFAGTEFKQFLMHKDEVNSGYILFDLSTQALEAKL